MPALIRRIQSDRKYIPNYQMYAYDYTPQTYIIPPVHWQVPYVHNYIQTPYQYQRPRRRKKNGIQRYPVSRSRSEAHLQPLTHARFRQRRGLSMPPLLQSSLSPNQHFSYTRGYTEEEILSQQRLAAFLLDTTLPQRPPTPISLVDSHLYESVKWQQSNGTNSETVSSEVKNTKGVSNLIENLPATSPDTDYINKSTDLDESSLILAKNFKNDNSEAEPGPGVIRQEGGKYFEERETTNLRANAEVGMKPLKECDCTKNNNKLFKRTYLNDPTLKTNCDKNCPVGTWTRNFRTFEDINNFNTSFSQASSVNLNKNSRTEGKSTFKKYFKDSFNRKSDSITQIKYLFRRKKIHRVSPKPRGNHFNNTSEVTRVTGQTFCGSSCLECEKRIKSFEPVLNNSSSLYASNKGINLSKSQILLSKLSKIGQFKSANAPRVLCSCLTNSVTTLTFEHPSRSENIPENDKCVQVNFDHKDNQTTKHYCNNFTLSKNVSKYCSTCNKRVPSNLQKDSWNHREQHYYRKSMETLDPKFPENLKINRKFSFHTNNGSDNLDVSTSSFSYNKENSSNNNLIDKTNYTVEKGCYYNYSNNIDCFNSKSCDNLTDANATINNDNFINHIKNKHNHNKQSKNCENCINKDKMSNNNKIKDKMSNNNKTKDNAINYDNDNDRTTLILDFDSESSDSEPGNSPESRKNHPPLLSKHSLLSKSLTDVACVAKLHNNQQSFFHSRLHPLPSNYQLQSPRGVCNNLHLQRAARQNDCNVSDHAHARLHGTDGPLLCLYYTQIPHGCRDYSLLLSKNMDEKIQSNYRTTESSGLGSSDSSSTKNSNEDAINRISPDSDEKSGHKDQKLKLNRIPLESDKHFEGQFSKKADKNFDLECNKLKAGSRNSVTDSEQHWSSWKEKSIYRHHNGEKNEAEPQNYEKVNKKELTDAPKKTSNIEGKNMNYNPEAIEYNKLKLNLEKVAIMRNHGKRKSFPQINQKKSEINRIYGDEVLNSFRNEGNRDKNDKNGDLNNNNGDRRENCDNNCNKESGITDKQANKRLSVNLEQNSSDDSSLERHEIDTFSLENKPFNSPLLFNSCEIPHQKSSSESGYSSILMLKPSEHFIRENVNENENNVKENENECGIYFRENEILTNDGNFFIKNENVQNENDKIQQNNDFFKNNGNSYVSNENLYSNNENILNKKELQTSQNENNSKTNKNKNNSREYENSHEYDKDETKNRNHLLFSNFSGSYSDLRSNTRGHQGRFQVTGQLRRDYAYSWNNLSEFVQQTSMLSALNL